MNELFGFLKEFTQALVLFAKSSKQRATMKALRVAARIQRIDKRLNALREKETLNRKDRKRIRSMEKKKVNLWKSFNHYMVIN